MSHSLSEAKVVNMNALPLEVLGLVFDQLPMYRLHRMSRLLLGLLAVRLRHVVRCSSDHIAHALIRRHSSTASSPSLNLYLQRISALTLSLSSLVDLE